MTSTAIVVDVDGLDSLFDGGMKVVGRGILRTYVCALEGESSNGMISVIIIVLFLLA